MERFIEQVKSYAGVTLYVEEGDPLTELFYFEDDSKKEGRVVFTRIDKEGNIYLPTIKAVKGNYNKAPYYGMDAIDRRGTVDRWRDRLDRRRELTPAETPPENKRLARFIKEAHRLSPHRLSVRHDEGNTVIYCSQPGEIFIYAKVDKEGNIKTTSGAGHGNINSAPYYGLDQISWYGVAYRYESRKKRERQLSYMLDESTEEI